jgi:23S rRNA pseudouridine955/2504/2580 synthase/23S rRNA pseudouridine1911/1915/1917 synthase
MRSPALPLLFEDEHVVAVDKPSGLLSLPDRFDASLPSVRSLLEQRYGSIFIVHRLDRETSGVMLAARTAEAHKHLSEQFEHHSVGKYYHALVSGIVERDTFPIDIPLAPDARRKGLMRPSARGKEAHTEVTVIERFRLATLIECRLITGRTHQIRVHCSAIGHPLLVDPDYGTADAFFLSTIKRRYNIKKDTAERPIIDRLTLHSRTIEFVHPASEEATRVESQHPRDFAAAVQVLRKYAAPYTSSLRWE